MIYLLCSLAFGGEVVSLSLQDAVDRIGSRSESVRSAEADVLGADADKDAAFGAVSAPGGRRRQLHPHL